METGVSSRSRSKKFTRKPTKQQSTMKVTHPRFVSALAALAASAALATSASAAVVFNETFEGYTLGDVAGQGLWADFGGAELTNVVDTMANGGTKSLAFSTKPAGGYGSDATVEVVAPITAGQLVLSFDIFHPTTNDGDGFFYFSRGATLATVFQQGISLEARGTAGTFGDDGSPKTGLLTGQWVPVVMNIDLDADTLVATYGGTQIFNGAWITDAGLPSQYQGIDIWADGGTSGGSFYIDNLRLDAVPEPSSIALLGLGAGGLFFRRRRA
jgi:hypothetical protein